MDFKRAIDLVTKDPDWMRKCFMAGLPILVPVIGIIALFGWQRRIFENVRQGREELPDPSFGEDLSRGVDPFIALLNPMPFVLLAAALLFGIPFALMAAVGVVAGDSGAAGALGALGALVQLVAMLIWFVIILAMNVAMPELLRRGLKGERFPLMSPGPSIAAIRANPTPFIMVIVASVLANIVGGIGIYLCCVGMFLTMPAANAFYTHMLVQWDQKAGG